MTHHTTQVGRAFSMLAAWLVVYGGSVAADDWPAWRRDANRSGATPEQLPDALHLRWVRKLPPVLRAWPMNRRLRFDESYEPVVAGQRLYLGSPNDGSIRAYDTDTGAQVWRVYTEGPVRFAPTVWEGKVYAGSDDGFVYCLDAQTGARLWSFRGAPKDRPDRRHLGNNRLISFWPVRGGPIVHQGRLYVGVGLWPAYGVWVYALDARTGTVVWENGDLGLIERVRIDHNSVYRSCVSPQGYMTVAGKKLLVPNGRGMPAALDLETGKLIFYRQAYRNGDCRVVSIDNFVFVGPCGALNLHDGRELGTMYNGNRPPRGKVRRHISLGESPAHPYKTFPGCDAWSVLTPGAAYGAEQGYFFAYDLAHTTVALHDSKWHGNLHRARRWQPRELWRLRTPYAVRDEKVLYDPDRYDEILRIFRRTDTVEKPASKALLKAGDRLYGHADRTLIAIGIPNQGAQPRIVWQHLLDGVPGSILAADGKLFVATREGHPYCFSERRGDAVRHEQRVEAHGSETWRTALSQTLANVTVRGGYCLVLGIMDGGLIEELLLNSGFKVIGIDGAPEKIERLRDRYAGTEFSGNRVELYTGTPETFPLPPY